jgi:ABC-2 type transport system permease protein
MARHLVRLKLALLRGSLSTGGLGAKVAVGITYLFALGVGGLAGFGMTGLRGLSDRDFDLAVPAIFAGLLLGWALLPVLTVAVENTLDIDRLSLFPLDARDLMPGLLLAAMIGFGGLFTALVVIGGIAGTAPASPLAVLTAAAFLLELAVCVAASRLVATALSAFTRRRRWRDIALTVVPLTWFGLNILFRVYAPGAGSLKVAAVIGRFLPSGPGAFAVVEARRGEALGALAGVLVEAALLLLALRLWWAAIERVLTTATESGGSQSGPAVSSLIPRWARWLPANRVGGVAAKELRLNWREPRRRTGLISAAFLAIFPLLTTHRNGGGPHAVVLFAAFPAVVFGLNALNQFTWDGPRYWTHVIAGDDTRSDLIGKNIETAIIGVPLTLALSAVVGAVTGGWEYVVPTLFLGVLALGVELGVGNVLSVAMPIAAPESGTNAWANNSGQGLQMLGPIWGAMLLMAVFLAPFGVATVALVHSPALVVVLAGEVGIGLAVWRLGLGIGVRRATGRQADLLERLSRTRGT